MPTRGAHRFPPTSARSWEPVPGNGRRIGGHPAATEVDHYAIEPAVGRTSRCSGCRRRAPGYRRMCFVAQRSDSCSRKLSPGRVASATVSIRAVSPALIGTVPLHGGPSSLSVPRTRLGVGREFASVCETLCRRGSRMVANEPARPALRRHARRQRSCGDNPCGSCGRAHRGSHRDDGLRGGPGNSGGACR